MKKGIKLFSLLMMLVVLGVSIPATDVKAGAKTTVLNSSSFKNKSDWNNVQSQVKIEDNKLIFPADSTDKTGFICKSILRRDEFFSSLAVAEFDLQFTKLPAGQSFVLAFGLPGIESKMANRGNVEITFSNNNGIKVGVVAYEQANTPVTVCTPKSAGMNIGAKAKIRAEVTTAGQILVSVNGQQICSGKLPVTGEGRMGFLQTGMCAAEISEFKLTTYQYFRPENTNINEDFDEESLNISVLMGRTKKGKNTFSFEKYNNNSVLMFKSVGTSFIGTLAHYSNFEMTFDVPYMTTTSGIDENQQAIEATGSIGISFGSDKTNLAADGYKNAIDMVTFGDGQVYSYQNKAKYNALNPYWQEGKPFSLQVIVKDCTVTVGAKAMNEKNYQTLLTYDIANRDVTGYVHFWVVDKATMAIDNFKITNLDHNPALVEKEFVSGKIEKPADWVYEPFERVYAPEAEDEAEEADAEKTISWYLLIPTTALAGIIVLVVVDRIIYVSQKKKKKKEGVADEQ